MFAAIYARKSTEQTGTAEEARTDQIVMSRTPGVFRTVLAPRGSSKPEWLSR